MSKLMGKKIFTILRLFDFMNLCVFFMPGMVKERRWRLINVVILLSYMTLAQGKITSNSGIFARVSFSRNFADAKFRENNTLVKC